MINKKVIVRGDRSGVFFGTLKSQEGQIVTLVNFRKIWRWENAHAVEQIAVDGCGKSSKITIEVSEGLITDAIQIIECSDKSIESIEAIAVWKV